MSVVEVEGMTQEEVSDWESELWSYMSNGDGFNCPLHDDCRTKQRGGWCFDDNIVKQRRALQYGTNADDSISNLSEPDVFKKLYQQNFPHRWIPCRIFRLVESLANKYIQKAELNQPPVNADLVREIDINPNIELRKLPMKSYHGAVWQLEDAWVIHLNDKDSPVRQNMTLFHEVFHILAHRRSTPIFRKQIGSGGEFNEMLANHFAASIMMPKAWIREKWAEVGDVNKMVEIFQVSELAMWIKLRQMNLI